jgi:N-acetylmuramoyl-L-alanine amidase
MSTAPILVPHPSPNFDRRPPGYRVDMLVLHYTGMRSAEAALARLCDPEAKVSAHYCIDEDGTVYILVDEAHRAWHAGKSAWAGATDINACSIGIELVNPGHEWGYRDFPEPQMAALEALAAEIVHRHEIPARRVLGHSDVAPTRKQDPGERFDWPRLARRGIGLWPAPAPDLAASPDRATVLAGLRRYGYEAPDGDEGPATAAIIAFQRHFRPRKLDGAADAETAARLAALLRLLDGPH